MAHFHVKPRVDSYKLKEFDLIQSINQVYLKEKKNLQHCCIEKGKPEIQIKSRKSKQKQKSWKSKQKGLRKSK
jgi:hypothetical protein